MQKARGRKKRAPKGPPEKPPAPPEAQAPRPPVEARPEVERVYAYLKEHGAAGAPAISRALNMDLPTVVKALRSLREQGKVRLTYSLGALKTHIPSSAPRPYGRRPEPRRLGKRARGVKVSVKGQGPLSWP